MSKEHINMQYLAGERIEDLAIVEASLEMTIQWMEKKNRPVAKQMKKDLQHLTFHLDERLHIAKLKELEDAEAEVKRLSTPEAKLAAAEAKVEKLKTELGLVAEPGPTPAESV